jgi:hypothetical protein
MEIARKIYKVAQNLNFFNNRYLKGGGVADCVINKLIGFETKSERLEWLTGKPVSYEEYVRIKIKDLQQKFKTRAAITGPLTALLYTYFRHFGGQITAKSLKELGSKERMVLLGALRSECYGMIETCEQYISKRDNVLGFRSLRSSIKREYNALIKELKSDDYNECLS